MALEPWSSRFPRHHDHFGYQNSKGRQICMRRDGDNQNPVINSDLLNDTITNNITRLCEYFFPLGVQKGTDWAIGDTSGAKGQSLRINLSPEKTGQWQDFSNGEKGTFAGLIQKSKNLSFPQAADAIGNAIGINLRLAAIQERKASIPFDWRGTDFKKLSEAEKQQLSEWRGLSRGFVDYLDGNDLIRVYKDSNWAFPIEANGKILGAHCRPIINPNGSHVDWEVVPSNKKGGPGLRLFVIEATPGQEVGTIHIFESQWDMLAACDKLAIHKTDGIAAICTRGSANTKTMSQLPSEPKLYLWTQNDRAGRAWFNKILESVNRPVYNISIPSKFKDLNEWTLSGVSSNELSELISKSIPIDSSLKEEPTISQFDLPAIQGPEELNVEDVNTIEQSKPIIAGVLREQSKMALSSGSKGRKSWLLIDLALSVASGAEWLGFQTIKSKVLYLNFELKESTFKWRMNLVRKARDIESHELHVMHLRGRARDIESLVKQTKDIILKDQYKLIILDPMYKCLGNRDENSAKDVNDYLNHVEQWCTYSLASVIMTGHFPKGDMGLRQGNDRQSGSGVLARDPDIVANFMWDQMRSGESNKSIYAMEFSGMREDLEIPPFYIQWDKWSFVKLDGTVYGTKKGIQRLRVNDMMDVLFREFNGMATPKSWLSKYTELFCEKRMSDDMWTNWRREMRKNKLIKQSGPNNGIICEIEDGAKAGVDGNWYQSKEPEPDIKIIKANKSKK